MISNCTTEDKHTSSPQIPIYGGPRIIGYVLDGTFFGRISQADIVGNPPAIVVNFSILDDAEHSGATRLEFTDSVTRRVYRVWCTVLRLDGRMVRTPDVIGIALLMDHWNISEKKSTALG